MFHIFVTNQNIIIILVALYKRLIKNYGILNKMKLIKTRLKTSYKNEFKTRKKIMCYEQIMIYVPMYAENVTSRLNKDKSYVYQNGSLLIKQIVLFWYLCI